MAQPPHEILELAADSVEVRVSMRVSGSEGCCASEHSTVPAAVLPVEIV